MNKRDLIDAISSRMGEKQVRPARTARNPATGAAIKVPKTSVPKFRAGADFKAMVNGK